VSLRAEMRQDLLYALDPARWAVDAVGFRPDDWQSAVLQDPAHRVALNITRQGGKSTIAAIKALHTAIYWSRSLTPTPGPVTTAEPTSCSGKSRGSGRIWRTLPN